MKPYYCVDYGLTYAFATVNKAKIWQKVVKVQCINYLEPLRKIKKGLHLFLNDRKLSFNIIVWFLNLFLLGRYPLGWNSFFYGKQRNIFTICPKRKIGKQYMLLKNRICMDSPRRYVGLITVLKTYTRRYHWDKRQDIQIDWNWVTKTLFMR